MAELMFPNVMGNVLAMGEAGKQSRLANEAEARKNQFNALSAQALTGDPDAYAQQVAIDPAQAMQVQKAGDISAQRVRGAAKYMQQALASNNPAQIQGAWNAVRPFLASAGAAQGMVPPEQWDPALMPGLQEALAKTAYLDYGGDQRNTVVSPGSAVVDPQTGRVVYERAYTPKNQTISIPGPDGRERQYTFDALNNRYVPAELAQGAAFGQASPQATIQAEDGSLMPVTQFIGPDGQRINVGNDLLQVNGMPGQGAAQGGLPMQAAPMQSPQSQIAQSPFVSRTPEETAAATEAARLGVQLQALPQELQMRTNAALSQEQGKAEIGTNAELATTQAKRSASANDALSLLDEAENLIPVSTGSLIGAGADRAAAMFGESTPGANAIAALKTISGQLVSKMPRMEGPQSDRDVQMYKDMAGNLGDPTVPREQRMAALQMIRSLNSKYANQDRPTSSPARATSSQQQGTQPGTGSGRRLRFNPATGRIE